MTTFRLISLPMHGLVELGIGMALMFAPFALGLAPAGLVLGVAFGVLIFGLALGAADALAVSAHLSLDQALVVGLAGAAAAVALAGDPLAGLTFAAASAALLALSLTTRYSRVPGAR